MSKKPEIKIYPEYKFGVKFPAWTEEPITIPAKVHNAENFKATSEGLKNWLKTSNGWLDVRKSKIEVEKRRTIAYALKAMLGREPYNEDLEKIEELDYNGTISLICFDGKPIAFCECRTNEITNAPYIFLTPTKYFKDEKS